MEREVKKCVWFLSLPICQDYWLPCYVVFEDEYSNSDWNFIKNIPTHPEKDVECIATLMGPDNSKRVRVFQQSSLKKTFTSREREHLYAISYEAIKTLSLSKPKKDVMLRGYIEAATAAESFAESNKTQDEIVQFFEGREKSTLKRKCSSQTESCFKKPHKKRDNKLFPFEK